MESALAYWESTVSIATTSYAACLRFNICFTFVGAGKTTTFNILTGDISMTSGTGVIAGYDIRTNLRDVS